MAVLRLLPPAQYQAWQLLFELDRTVGVPWALIGGQLVALLAAEHGAALPRTTQDADVLVDVRAAPGGIETVCAFLADHGLELEGVSPEGVGHRFSRVADPGPGHVSVDVLAPDGLSEHTRTVTVPPARTVSVPTGSQTSRAAVQIQPRYYARTRASSIEASDLRRRLSCFRAHWVRCLRTWRAGFRAAARGRIPAGAAAFDGVTREVRRSASRPRPRGWFRLQSCASSLDGVRDPLMLCPVSTSSFKTSLSSTGRTAARVSPATARLPGWLS
jgi:hypothetical protein